MLCLMSVVFIITPGKISTPQKPPSDATRYSDKKAWLQARFEARRVWVSEVTSTADYLLNRAPPYETISALDSKIAAALSGMGFYQTWGLQDRNIEETESFLSAYESAAEFFEAPIIHIGRAWDYFYTLHSEEPPFSLYLDEANPTEEGKALIAYVVYAYVTGESPLLTTTLGLDGDDALLLQNTAWDSYQMYGLQFHP